ncbi:uncharacterized protein LOC134837090 [Culicoides brevitarsis]|uniref:uncharacterized protein LOC134837090 n=1 Tax=Culicoides brevitarsis TaxID=469753 RepID=UPI00307B7CCA
MPAQRKTKSIDKRIHLGRWITGRHNLYPGLNLSKFFESSIESTRDGPFPYFLDYPQPLSDACIPLTREWKDIGSDIVERSSGYFKELNFVKEKMMCNKKLCRLWNVRLKQRGLSTNGDGPFNIYPVELLEYAKLLELNPEPEFIGGYNWYLTGGSLSVVRNNDKNYIVRPFGEELNHLEIIPVNKKGKHMSINKATKIDLSKGGPIHEVSTKTIGKDLIVMVRSKRNIGLLQQSSETTLSNFESKVPYVSCDLTSEDRHLATTNTDKQFRVYDLSTQQTLNKFDLDYLSSLLYDNWSCVKRFQSNSYIYADRRNLRPLDIRTKVIGSYLNVGEYGEICDHISCIAPSQRYEHLIYVGSSHRLFAIDLRNFSGTINEQNMTLSWTHMMNLPPCMVKTTAIDNSEIILASSNLTGDARIFLTDFNSEYKNLYLPLKIPSIIDSLQVAKDNFICLNPVSSVNRRVRLCQTGMDFMTNSSDRTISIISQNSICDVFKQNVMREKIDDISIVCEKMKNWAEMVDDTEILPETKEFGATAVIYKKDMVRVLKSTRLTRPNKLEEEVEAAKPKQRPRWQQSITKLSNYKDALVESIMEVWDLPIDDKDLLDLPKDEPEPLDIKIQAWLAKSQSKTDTYLEFDEKCQEPGMELTLADSKDSNEIQTPTQQDACPIKTQVTPAKTKSKKKKHVMGF